MSTTTATVTPAATPAVAQVNPLVDLAQRIASKEEALKQAEMAIGQAANTAEVEAASKALAAAQEAMKAAQEKAKKTVEDAESKRDAIATELEDLRGHLTGFYGNGKAHKAKAVKSQKSTAKADGAGRGKKQCPSCKKFVGARSHECECGHKFAVAEKSDKPAKTKVVKHSSSKKADEGGRGRRGEGEDLASMVCTVLGRNQSGLKLEQITAKVLNAGYKTQSQNLTQAVYNVLAKLKKEDKVEKDTESKKYTLAESAA